MMGRLNKVFVAGLLPILAGVVFGISSYSGQVIIDNVVKIEKLYSATQAEVQVENSEGPEGAIVVVSDTSNYCIETGGNAVACWVHHAWPSISGATWIWKTYLAQSWPDTATFTKEFEIPWSVEKAEIMFTADNLCKVYINSHYVGWNPGGWGSLHTSDVSDYLIKGTNRIKVWALNYTSLPQNNTPYLNPGGVIYKLAVSPLVAEFVDEDGNSIDYVCPFNPSPYVTVSNSSHGSFISGKSTEPRAKIEGQITDLLGYIGKEQISFDVNGETVQPEDYELEQEERAETEPYKVTFKANVSLGDAESVPARISLQVNAANSLGNEGRSILVFDIEPGDEEEDEKGGEGKKWNGEVVTELSTPSELPTFTDADEDAPRAPFFYLKGVLGEDAEDTTAKITSPDDEETEIELTDEDGDGIYLSPPLVAVPSSFNLDYEPEYKLEKIQFIKAGAPNKIQAFYPTTETEASDEVTSFSIEGTNPEDLQKIAVGPENWVAGDFSMTPSEAQEDETLQSKPSFSLSEGLDNLMEKATIGEARKVSYGAEGVIAGVRGDIGGKAELLVLYDGYEMERVPVEVVQIEIVLTFDDGPVGDYGLYSGNNYSVEILKDLLANNIQSGIKACFFVLSHMENRERDPGTDWWYFDASNLTVGQQVIEMEDEHGHIVAVHGGGMGDHEHHTDRVQPKIAGPAYDADQDGKKDGQNALESDLIAAKIRIKNLTGQTAQFVRPPVWEYEIGGDKVIKTYQRQSLKMILTDIHPSDTGERSPWTTPPFYVRRQTKDTTVLSLRSSIRTLITTFHDWNDWTAANLADPEDSYLNSIVVGVEEAGFEPAADYIVLVTSSSRVEKILKVRARWLYPEE